MSTWLIALTTLIYFIISVEQFVKSNPGMGITYAGYTFANIGLFMLATK